jgi:SNF2 family DNA or RNA helicase
MPLGRQIIIWTNYVVGVQLISDAISKAFGKDSFITCYGSQDTYEQVQLFKRSGKPYCIANPTKMGVGQNIQFSNYQAFYSNSWSQVIRDQAESRQHRQGQKENVTIIDILARKTVDELRLKALMGKKDLAINLSQLSKVLKNKDDFDNPMKGIL